MTHDKPDVIVMRACALAFIAMILIACAPMKPCDPERLNCDNGTRSTGGSISRPSVSNNPAGLSGGGQVSNPGPSKPSTGPGKPGHGPKGGGKGHGHHGGHGKGKGK